jgi:predicted MPP superfamily phosphohydrolase
LKICPPPLHDFTIVHLSDIHDGLAPGERLLPEAIKISNRASPDIVVLTGDFVDVKTTEDAQRNAERVARQLAKLHSQKGIVAVLGNHDMWQDGDIVAKELQGEDISVLRNERIAIEVSGTQVWLIGIEDAGFTMCISADQFQRAYNGYDQIMGELLEDLPENDLRMMLAHNPDLITLLPEERVDILLGGHTHGGYARLPLVGALFTPSCYGQQWVAGLIKHEHTWMYVNRGLGGLPMRLGARPEITILHLIPQ